MPAKRNVYLMQRSNAYAGLLFPFLSFMNKKTSLQIIQILAGFVSKRTGGCITCFFDKLMRFINFLK